MKNISKVLSVILLGGINLYGAGIAAGTQVDNSVKLNYKVDGNPQSEVTSNTTSFKVDNKIDLTMSSQDNTAAKSDTIDQILKFIVTNEGNKVQDYSLTSTQSTGDDFDTNNVEIYVDSDDDGIYDSSKDTKSYIDELAPDASITVFIISDVPTQSDGDKSKHALIAQVAEGGNSGSQGADITKDDAGSADTAMGIEIVFADEAGSEDSNKDGKYSINASYIVSTAQLTAKKESCVVSDPFNGTSNPKRIPGATVRYAIEIENTSNSKDATDVEVTDTLESTLDYNSSVIKNEACDCASPSGTDTGSTSVAGQDVTLKFGDVNQTKTMCGYIEVIVK